MQRDMKQWLRAMIDSDKKKTMPVLSFPAVQLMDVSVKELISDSTMQARGMKLIADRVDSAASVSLMDLSVEAECFGAEISVSEDEVPTVVGSVVSSLEEAQALQVPQVGAGRTGIYLDAMKKAVELITDRPVFAGIIGPFSLAGRLADVTEIMIYCYEEPDMVHTILEKATQFLIDYAKAYKETGANGIVMAEPLAGLLSPDLAEEFSAPYVKRVVDAVQSDQFAVIYHNCGNSTIRTIDSILSTGSAAYHFGNAISMQEMLPLIPRDTVVMGNIDPAGEFRNGTPESIRKATLELMEDCCPKYPNFVVSSGCDIPPHVQVGEYRCLLCRSGGVLRPIKNGLPAFLRAFAHRRTASGFEKRTDTRFARVRPFVMLQHFQKLNLFAGGTGEKPVFQSAEQARHHPFFRGEERIHTGGAQIGGRGVHIVHIDGKVRQVPLLHGYRRGRLDQLQRHAAQIHQSQEFLPGRGGNAAPAQHAAADGFIKRNALAHVPGIDGHMAQSLIVLLHASSSFFPACRSGRGYGFYITFSREREWFWAKKEKRKTFS